MGWRHYELESTLKESNNNAFLFLKVSIRKYPQHKISFYKIESSVYFKNIYLKCGVYHLLQEKYIDSNQGSKAWGNMLLVHSQQREKC